jgi:predicted RecA/RadA family phage recombinase
MADAILVKDNNANSMEVLSAEIISPHEIQQLPDGRAGVGTNVTQDVPVGCQGTMQLAGQFTVTKTAGLVILDGAKVYWDRSANAATPLHALAGADFYAGVAIGDAASAATTVVIDLNVQPVYTVDAINDLTDTVDVGDATVAMGPGYATLNIAATSEAEKTDIMTQRSVPVVSGSAIPFIVEGRIAIIDTPSGAATDFNIGLANDTHATSADSITEYVFLHFDNSLNILAQSADGTTTTSAIDTTVDAVEGTYFDFAFDCRDLDDILIYINGVNVLPASDFTLADATGPIKLLAHIEKTTGTEVGILRVAELTIRATEVAA